MKLSTAKEIMELNIQEAGKKMPPDTLDALKLHVEAVKRELRNRDDPDYLLCGLLPGETPEGDPT